MPSRRVSLSDELKAAVRELPEREKDKLLFRLLPGKPDLVRRLEFELLEDGNTAELRRDELLESLNRYLDEAAKNYYSPGYLLMDLRHASGRITEHVKTTRDKEGELVLNIALVLHSLPRLTEKIAKAKPGKARTLTKWTVSRIQKILKLLAKRHPDEWLDYGDDLRDLAKLLRAVPFFERAAVEVGADIAALERGEVM